MSRAERVGQLFMVGESSAAISSDRLRALDRKHIGSVVLLGNTTRGQSSIERLTRRVRDRVEATDGVRVMVAVDQEGGLVQRLKGSGFSTIPSAEQQADYSDASLERHAATWARQLKAAGINANLAPVADVVPRSMRSENQPIGVLHRGYGSDPEVVVAKVDSFVRGMRKGGVATGVKHFPGLGRVRGNTDFEARVVDRVTTRHDANLAGFAAGIRGNTDLVMVSSAVYDQIDDRRPATFSPTVLHDMIRSDLGFTGVVISDDLLGRTFSSTPVDNRATRFIAAGGDLAIVGDPDRVSAIVAHTVAEAKRNPDFDAKVTASAARVLTMKARHGLARCA